MVKNSPSDFSPAPPKPLLPFPVGLQILSLVFLLASPFLSRAQPPPDSIKARQLDSVTVSGKIIHKDQISTAVKSTLSGQALDETRGASLGESLKGITGVNSIQTGPSISKPIIHGVYSNRILLLNNGVRQEGQNWGNDHAPEIDPFIATRVTVIKGAASIRYGSDAIGGVVLLDPKDLRADPGIDGELNLVGISNGHIGVVSGMIEGALGAAHPSGVAIPTGISSPGVPPTAAALPADNPGVLSWRLQGTLKEAGNAQTAHYYLGNTGFHENDYSATLQYDKAHYGASLYYSRFNTKIGIADASEVGSASDFIHTPSAPAVPADFSYDINRPYQTVNHQLLKASGFLDLPHNGGKLEATYAYQRDLRTEFDADPSYNSNGNTNNTPDLDFQLNTSTVDLVWEHPAIKKKITGSIGLDFITHGNLEQGTTYVQLIPNFVDYSGGIFVIEKMQVKKWTLEAGWRYDYRWLQVYRLDPTTLAKYSPIQDWQNQTVNAGAIYRFNDHFSGTFNFGSAWRPPSVLELWADGIHQSAASWQFGDSTLKLEKAYNFSTAVKYSGDRFEAELGVYANNFQNYIYARPDTFVVSTAQGTYPAFTYTPIRHALFTGIDLSFTWHFWDHLSWISKTSIVRARDLDGHQWIINVPADRYDNTLRYQRTAIGPLKNVYIGVNNLLVSKQIRVLPLLQPGVQPSPPGTPPSPPGTPPPSPGSPLTIPQQIFSKLITPPAGYMLWGAEAGCTLPLAHRDIHISLSVTNLANTAYRDYLNLFRYYVDDLGRNVTLRLLVPFGSR